MGGAPDRRRVPRAGEGQNRAIRQPAAVTGGCVLVSQVWPCHCWVYWSSYGCSSYRPYPGSCGYGCCPGQAAGCGDPWGSCPSCPSGYGWYGWDG
ncbi:hypothetical protein [Streptomyces galbus]|uniref:Uncharacterized protein n=1 Tax=Streptomyces galbus TaxID=33898 RepID=A0ABX1IQX2_STRGB|nr:hypothetical protein [Streptomyces galbus]NKQ26648.1 hypothetical protein [Streptomyces galbus]